MPILFFEVGSVVEVEYPYEDCTMSKKRPAVIIEITDNQITAVSLKISSSKKYENTEKYPYAVEVIDIVSAGLNKRSWVLTDKELTIDKRNKLELIGHLSELDYETVKAFHELALADGSIVRLSYDD
jgi:mRNA-degrading endonuclease toxin of MazEF toxin-antitoxin module